MSTSFIISKKFKFDAGHRVWTQELDESLSGDSSCICKHIHGHEYHVEVYLRRNSNGLQQNGMVTDFKHLAWFKNMIDTIFDHGFMIHKEDPLFDLIIGNIIKQHESELGVITFNANDIKPMIVSYKDLDDLDVGRLYILSNLLDEQNDVHLYEYINSFIITTFIPTAENLAKYFYDVVNFVFKDKGVICPKVVVLETSKSKAEYGDIEW